jgi:hypothetical protein
MTGAVAAFAALSTGFPVLNGTTTANIGSASSTHNIVMPASVSAGELLLVFGTFYRAAVCEQLNVTNPSGWTQLWHSGFGEGGGAKATCAGYAKLADGTEDGASINFATNDSSTAVLQCRKIGNAYASIAGVEDGTPVNGAHANPNPPALTASWGMKAALWIAVAHSVFGANSVSAYPSNFENGAEVDGTNFIVGSATRKSVTATLDPGAFALTSSANHLVNTIVIRPRF